MNPCGKCSWCCNAEQDASRIRIFSQECTGLWGPMQAAQPASASPKCNKVRIWVPILPLCSPSSPPASPSSVTSQSVTVLIREPQCGHWDGFLTVTCSKDSAEGTHLHIFCERKPMMTAIHPTYGIALLREAPKPTPFETSKPLMSLCKFCFFLFDCLPVLSKR